MDQKIKWTMVEYENPEKVMGRIYHTALTYMEKIFMFGGSFMYNKKRQMRECLNQVVVFDPKARSMNVLKTSGISIQPRKNHCAAIFSIDSD